MKVDTKLVKWEEVVNWCKTLSQKIISSDFYPDIIVAIARGGFVPARLLCDFLDLDDLASVQILHWGKAAEVTSTAHVKYEFQLEVSQKNLLLVDDIVDTGDSMIVAKEFIESKWKPKQIKTAAMQWISNVAKIKPDFYAEEVKEWVWYQYPWTRTEDTSDFIEKIMLEEKKNGKVEWSFKELVSKFKEVYGINVGRSYFKVAIDNLLRNKKIQRKGSKLMIP